MHYILSSFADLSLHHYILTTSTPSSSSSKTQKPFLSQTVARPVCKLLALRFLKNMPTPYKALSNQRIMFTKSIHTAFFMRWISEFPSGSSWMKSLPKMPKSAVNRILFSPSAQASKNGNFNKNQRYDHMIAKPNSDNLSEKKVGRESYKITPSHPNTKCVRTKGIMYTNAVTAANDPTTTA